MDTIPIESNVTPHSLIGPISHYMSPDKVMQFVIELCEKVEKTSGRFTIRLIAKLREKPEVQPSQKVDAALTFLKSTLSDEELEILRAYI